MDAIHIKQCSQIKDTGRSSWCQGPPGIKAHLRFAKATGARAAARLTKAGGRKVTAEGHLRQARR
eukprot:5827601-Pyramimonas_sp.AAC.1